MEVVSHIVKFNSQTNGRDKLCRLCQYAAKLAGWHIKQHGLGAELTQKFKNLETALSSTRKVLRMGKSLDMLQGAFRNLAEPNTLIRLCLVVAKLNQAIYLLVDHYIWMSKTGLVKADSKKLAKLAAKFWLITLIANLVRNFYDIMRIVIRERRSQRVAIEKRNGDVSGVDGMVNGNATGQMSRVVTGGSLVGSVLQNRPVVVDAIKNMADLFLPLSSLNYVNISEGTQGLLGMISSYMGIVATWNPALKLVPS